MTNEESVPKAATPPAKAKLPWTRRLPSSRRFVIWNIIWWLFGGAALVGGLFYTEYVVRPVAESGGTDYRPLQVLKAEETGERVFGNSDRLNVLLLGIDYNYDEKGILYTTGARSDTMMVVSLSRDGKFLNVVSIPRDTRVYIGEGYGYEKINSAYSYGGVEQAKKTASEFLGIPIQHHVVVKVQGAKDLIDALGGLAIDVEKDMDWDDNWGNLHIHLKKGPQVLTGEQAVGYARFRMDEEGDRGRIRRQQQVIRVLGSKVREPALISRLSDIAKVVKQTIDTDFKILDMVGLATLYGSFDFAGLRSGTVVGDDAVDANGTSYIEPYAPENERTVRRLLKSLEWLSKADLRIKIVYKKASSDVAYGLADRLSSAGFVGSQVEMLTEEDPTDTTTTYVSWLNKVPRLEGVVNVVTGDLKAKKGRPTSNSEDDLLIVIGDKETGNWPDLPGHLKETAPPQPLRTNSYSNGNFVPRQLPPSRHSIEQPYVPAEAEESEAWPDSNNSDQDVTQPGYPTVPSEAVAPELPAPVPREVIPVPTAPAERPATVQIVPPPVDVAPAPAPLPAPLPAPVPMPAATPIGF